MKQSDFRAAGQSAGGNESGGERGGGSLGETGGVGFLLRNAERYELTEDQRENLSKMQIPFELEKVDKLAALSKAKIVLRALVSDEDAAEPDVMEAIDKVAYCEADLRKMRYHHLKAARAQLDAKQRKGLVKMNRERRHQRGRAPEADSISD